MLFDFAVTGPNQIAVSEGSIVDVVSLNGEWCATLLSLSLLSPDREFPLLASVGQSGQFVFFCQRAREKERDGRGMEIEIGRERERYDRERLREREREREIQVFSLLRYLTLSFLRTFVRKPTDASGPAGEGYVPDTFLQSHSG